MECREIQEVLSAYVDGEIGPQEKTRVEEHLPSCNDCSRVLSEFRAAIGHVRKLEELDPPPWLSGKIMAQVKSEAEKKKGLYERFFSPFLLPRPIHALAAVLVLVLSVYVFQTMKSSVRPAKAPIERERVAPRGERKDVAPAKEAKPRSETIEDKLSAARNGKALKKPSAEEPEVALREPESDAAGEDFARTKEEGKVSIAGKRMNKLPGAVSVTREKAAELDTIDETYGEVSPVEAEEERALSAGQVAKMDSKPMAGKKYEQAAFRQPELRLILQVEDLDAAQGEIEKVLVDCAGTVVKKEFLPDEKIIIMVMVPRKNLSKLTDGLEKIGKVKVAAEAFDKEVAPENIVSVSIEAILSDEGIN
ncbi:MAG: hypothetical protein GTO08_08745 [Deltaproteobacteria bacterium]|nr:hypothetical protein [Deltaproteobacteria bacterium]